MAVSASFVRLHREELKELANAITGDDPQGLTDFLSANGTAVVEFDGDADIFTVLLPVLAEEYDIDLETSENGIVSELAEACEALVFILTLEEQTKYLEDLAPEGFSVEDLNEAYESFIDGEREGAGEAMLIGINTLYQALQEVDDDHVVVVTVE